MKGRPRVGVLTGDPRLWDLTKRDHRYNDEDLVTQLAMRAAFDRSPATASSSRTITAPCSRASARIRPI